MTPTDLTDYLGLDYEISLQRDEEGDWVARIKELEGCLADGETPDEAIQNLQSMKELWFRTRLRAHRPVPLPAGEQEEYSGKWLQRVPKSLHRKLVKAAEKEGVSLNQFATAVLAEAAGEKLGRSATGPAVTVLAVQGKGAWSTSSIDSHGEWKMLGEPTLDGKRRSHGIRSLLRKTLEPAEVANGREKKSADEETHQAWNAQSGKLDGR